MTYNKLHCVSKKVPTFKLSVTLSNLDWFQNFCTARKRLKFATKPIWQYPFHLRYVATLPWEIKNSNFVPIFSSCRRKCKQIAYLSPLTLIFSVFKIASCSPYWLQIKLSMFYYLFTFVINLWHWKFVTADVDAVFVNDQHGIQRWGEDLDKNT